VYKGALIEVNVDQSTASLKVVDGPDVTVDVYGKAQTVTGAGSSFRFDSRL
jgi:hypothetical protein